MFLHAWFQVTGWVNLCLMHTEQAFLAGQLHPQQTLSEHLLSARLSSRTLMRQTLLSPTLFLYGCHGGRL